MTVKELIERLQQCKNQDQLVMFQDPNGRSCDGPYAVCSVKECKSNGGFPKDWNMPKGFQYIQLDN